MPETTECPPVEKAGFLSSPFWVTAPLAGTMLTAALAAGTLSDPVRIALIAGAVLTQAAYVVGNALVKAKK